MWNFFKRDKRTAQLDIKINPSYYKKTDPKIYEKCLKKALEETIKWCESECRKRAPVDTGTLRDHHSYKMGDKMAEVRNNCGYAGYVAFGTSRQAAQNYPLEIVKEVDEEQQVFNLFKDYLKKEKVDDK